MDDLSKMTARVRHAVTGSGTGGGGGLPTGGVGHQMLVTDADGNALWEDRLAYVYTGMVEILPENAPVFNEDQGAFLVTEPLTVPLVPGMNCTVTYNGVGYECPAQEVSEGDVQLIALGNIGALMGEEGTGEPFIFAQMPAGTETEGMYAQVMALDGAESVTIKITCTVETIHRLDRKYLPEYIYGEDNKDVTFLSETTLSEPLGATGNIVTFALPKPFDAPLVMNATYAVMWNGVLYECTPSMGTGFIMTQEAAIHLSVDGVFNITAEVFGGDDVTYYGVISSNDGSASVTLSITGVVNTVYPVPEKYLPKLNIVNGSAEGSLRSVNAAEEGISYEMGEDAVALGVGPRHNWRKESAYQKAR